MGRNPKTSRVVKDVTDPAFPHGEERGYWRGCEDACCLDAHSRASKVRALRRMRSGGSQVPVGPLREHVRSLTAHAGVTTRVVARVAGLSSDTLYGITGGAYKTVRLPTAEAILAVTYQRVLEHLSPDALVPTFRPRQQVYSMMAQGWSGVWIVTQIEANGNPSGQTALYFIKKNSPYCTVDTANKVAALAERVGASEGPSPHARSAARRKGYWPLAAYDDDGTLNFRRLPGHPWADADDMVGRLLDDLEWWSRHPKATDTEVSHSMDVPREPNEVKRLRERLVRLHGDRWHAVLRGAVDAYEQGADGTLEAVRAGIVLVGRVGSTQVPLDHPAAVEGRKRERVSQAS